MSVNTTSFKIAQYILMFFVAVLCIGILFWILIGDNAATDTTPAINDDVQITANTINN